jgi:hypothetical protein
MKKDKRWQEGLDKSHERRLGHQKSLGVQTPNHSALSPEQCHGVCGDGRPPVVYPHSSPVERKEMEYQTVPNVHMHWSALIAKQYSNHAPNLHCI